MHAIDYKLKNQLESRALLNVSVKLQFLGVSIYSILRLTRNIMDEYWIMLNWMKYYIMAQHSLKSISVKKKFI